MINIQDIIPFLKDGWVAMDKDGGAWELKQAHAKISADNITGEVIGNIHENADLLGEE